ncbi:MAG: acyl-CoA dehydratase activase [Synergistaceae bacterium]|jgi:predicted CoA-substrate-specific enzyme activase|nr:acyl-CoA dehydratase activase [Synergistaceae bacterium]
MSVSKHVLENIREDLFEDMFDHGPTVGLDIGSRATKGVLLADGAATAALEASGVSNRETADSVLQRLLDAANLKRTDLACLVSTGYGRITLRFDDIPSRILTEISCHAMGAHILNPATRTVIDIGGQDSKAIRVEPDSGKVVEFIMNDKCAAGTGRFLEKVAQLLEIELDELGNCALRSSHPAEISSQCVVFAESEVISLKAGGVSREDIAAGIHLATARRIRSLMRKIGLEPTVLFTGGTANNPGMREALEEVLEVKMGDSSLDATYAGALGAAFYAGRFARERQLSYGNYI